MSTMKEIANRMADPPCDPTPEEMEANAPAEERMLWNLTAVKRKIWMGREPLSHRTFYCSLINEVIAYLKEAIADRDRDYGHDDPDPDFTDPFGGE